MPTVGLCRPAGDFGREFLGYTGLVFEYWQAHKAGEITPELYRAWMAPVREGFEDLPRSQGDLRCHLLRALCRRKIPSELPLSNHAKTTFPLEAQHGALQFSWARPNV